MGWVDERTVCKMLSFLPSFWKFRFILCGCLCSHCMAMNTPVTVGISQKMLDSWELENCVCEQSGGSSEMNTSDLNHWTTSPAPCYTFKEQIKPPYWKQFAYMIRNNYYALYLWFYLLYIYMNLIWVRSSKTGIPNSI